MKKIALIFICIYFFANCKNENAEPGTTKIVFEHQIMKPWFDANCAVCHSTGKSNYLEWHYQPTDFAATFSAHNIHHVYERVYDERNMPKDKVLSDIELAQFKAWYDAGHLAK